MSPTDESLDRTPPDGEESKLRRALEELALDLRRAWRPRDAPWVALDPEIWERTHNPWFLLQNLSEERLQSLARDPSFQAEVRRSLDQRRSDLNALPWTEESGAWPARDQTVAYFSMEFGVDEAIPIYAGGLGILAGDYLKTASDLGLPLVGVGILFQEGYFRQAIDGRGRQREVFPYSDPSTLPLRPVSVDGHRLRVPIELPGRTLQLLVWQVNVGRVTLYLLDSNDPLNQPADRGITSRLYEAHPETRLLQEIVLGIGGWRALKLLGIRAAIAHLNEGHAAFAVLERAREVMQREKCGFREALWATRAGNVFTTHTPVVAGFDTFDPALIEQYAAPGGPLDQPGLSIYELLDLGRREQQGPFNMAYLAVRGCAHINGVSRLHGEVSRRLFADLFPRWPLEEVPVSHVTNGVHVPSWDSPTAQAHWERVRGEHPWRKSLAGLTEAMAAISDEQLWQMRTRQRTELVRHLRTRLQRYLTQRGAPPAAIAQAQTVLDPAVLTLGFARRFAEYKRPGLLLRDQQRLARLLRDTARPLQLVIAGKAHPADEGGKEIIAQWTAFVSQPDIRARAVFAEDYDMTVAAELTQGVDVWLNTPRRPWEACGTSGMKVLVNGGLNLSELDGWWAEAYDPEVGWALGGADAPSDERDATDLYDLLERHVLPEFYERDAAGMPRRWLQRVRASLSRLTPAFSSSRMLADYVGRIYRPGLDAHRGRDTPGLAAAKELARWQQHLAEHWGSIRFGTPEIHADGEGFDYRVPVDLGGLSPAEVRVELYAAPEGETPATPSPIVELRPSPRDGAMVFSARVTTHRPADHFTARVLPQHALAFVPAELPLIAWQR
jgi:starch phosphorylase